jgi:hypothetical protein
MVECALDDVLAFSDAQMLNCRAKSGAGRFALQTLSE